MTLTENRGPTPEVDPPVDPEAFDERGQLALLHRILFRSGFDDGSRAGHASLRLDDDTILVSPHHYSWDQVRRSRIAHMDLDGNVIGDVPVSPAAVGLHLALHRKRDDVRVAVHHHPEWATVWAAAHRVPPVYDQFGAFVRDDLVLYDDFKDNVYKTDLAEENVAAMGTSKMALLANHGVFVLGADIREAHLRCLALEHRCEIAWKVEALGGGVEVRPEVIDSLAGNLERIGGWPYLLESAIRRELLADPSILD
jgi:L-fuculose-phosphate aldolase